MKASKTKGKAKANSGAKTRASAVTKGGRPAMYIAGLPPYPERMAAYVAGDRSQLVSPAFADAADAIGKGPVHLHRLKYQERIALAGRELRWKRSPEGVLLWAPVALDGTDPRQTPDFAWLLEEARGIVAQGVGSTGSASAQQVPPSPSWLVDWAQSWAEWAHRHASIAYDKALKTAAAKKGSKPAKAAARAVSVLTSGLRVFLLEYLPQSGLTDAVRRARKVDEPRWLLPEELLNVAYSGHADEFRDDFWDRCCTALATEHKSRNRVISHYKKGESLSRDVQSFLDFVSGKLNEGQGAAGRFGNPFLPRSAAGVLLVRAEDENTGGQSADSPDSEGLILKETRYQAPVARTSDKSCSWISRDYPHLRAWEPFAQEYLAATKKGLSMAIMGLSLFFDRYLANAGKPGTPGANLNPECAKRPIADEGSVDALLVFGNKDRVPPTLDQVSGKAQRQDLRTIRDGFIPHILMQHCSLVEDGHTSLLPGYWNPFANIELDDKPGATGHETVRDAMPYRWIRRLRNILVQGPHFCDWAWAQQAQQSELGNSADWFEVDISLIDFKDPDCVWRKRSTGAQRDSNGRTFYELWSPVRWVALVTKLNTALRTMQVRVLDSGESDGLRFDLRQWAAQTYPPSSATDTLASAGRSNSPKAVPGAAGTPWVVNDIKARNMGLYASITAENQVRAKGSRRDPHGWTNGVLRPHWVLPDDSDHKRLTTLLYINTNKTADAAKEGAAKGFDVPLPMQTCPLPPEDAYWIREGAEMPPVQRTFASARLKQEWLDGLGENTHWWLAKLRDWQEKYNPINKRVQWKELSKTGLITEKSDEQYEMYRPACFLFREPSMNKSKNHPGPAYPLPDGVVRGAWWALLKELQAQFNGERTEGQPEYRLVMDDTGYSVACAYDLHSIRVSIITALIVDGKVPVQYVQALVGHSRIVMTIYYTKINPLTMMREIACGFTRATEAEVEREKEAIQNSTVAELRANSAFNDVESAMAALGIDRPPKHRNVVMWMRKLGGLCPVGGVTHDTEGGMAAGCFNGGPMISGKLGNRTAKYAQVDGGPGTCVNCRWFVARLPFIGELQAIGEAANYRYHEFKDKTALQEKKIAGIRDEFERIEIEQRSLSKEQKIQFNRKLDAAEAIRDGFMESAALDLMTSSNASRLIYRLSAISTRSDPDVEDALVANGSEEEVRIILEQTNSAILHASRVSIHSEIHPEINVPAATLRAAMVIARKLQDEDLDPFDLLSLPEDVQTRAVNSVTRHIASLCDPRNLNIGLSKAAALLESRYKLSEITGVSPLKLSDWVTKLADGQTSMPAVTTAASVGPLLN